MVVVDEVTRFFLKGIVPEQLIVTIPQLAKDDSLSAVLGGSEEITVTNIV